MASLKISGFEEVDKMFENLADSKKIAVKAIDAAAPILVDETKKAVRSAARKGYATGGLSRSFAATKPKTNSYGTYTVVKPVGSDSDGVHYAARAAYLEFGTTLNGRQKNSPQPWRQKAVNSARAKVEAKMEQTAFEEMEKLAR